MTEDDLLGVPREFLNAAVLIDDELFWGQPVEQAADELTEPSEFEIGSASDLAAKPSQSSESKIDAEKVVDGFSDLGLVCATYRWSEDHSTFPNSSDKADLIILDWKLDDTEAVGTTAVKFLNDRLKQDLEGKRRLRYIVIYTDKPMAGVIGKLSNELSVPAGISLVPNDDSVEIREDNGPSLWRILYQSKTVTEESALAKAVLLDFANFLNGLLPRAVMAGVAELRNRTFEHLYRFNKSVDPAVASHLLAKRSSKLEFPAAQDAFAEFVVGLIVNDFSDALHGSNMLRETASAQAVADHLLSDDGVKLRHNKLEVDATSEQFKVLVSEPNHSDFLNTAQDVFNLTPEKAEKTFSDGRNPMEFASVDDAQYAALSSIDLMSNYPRAVSDQYQLKSGVIVQVENGQDGSSGYLICVQPICDSVRLSADPANPNRFPFVELVEVEPTKKFSFVVKVGGRFVYLMTRYKVSELQMASFVASGTTGDVRTVVDGTNRSFVDVAGKPYRWISELKELYSIDLQNKLSSQANRIGNNKFEWLRARSG